MKHFNQLTPAEAERLALLLEELGEAQQVIGKILRHGYASTHPADPSGPTNRKLLEAELGDVQAAVALLRNAGDLSSSRILEAMEDKLGRVGKYLHHASVFPSGVSDASHYPPRSLRDYRPQHTKDCASRRPGAATMQSRCDCGLDALLAPPPASDVEQARAELLKGLSLTVGQVRSDSSAPVSLRGDLIGDLIAAVTAQAEAKIRKELS